MKEIRRFIDEIALYIFVEDRIDKYDLIFVSGGFCNIDSLKIY